MVDKKILELICCPDCHGDLLEKSENILVCKNCSVEYKQKDGILVLISKELEDELRN